MDWDVHRRRVVVTGLGVASSLGTTMDTLWKGIADAQCGIGPISLFDASQYTCRIAAEVHGLNVKPAFPNSREIRRSDRYAQFGVFAGWQALMDSGIDLEKTDRDAVGVFIGSGIGGLQTIEEQHRILLNRGPNRVSPFIIPMHILNIASGLLSMYHGLRGPNLATCSACATSAHAIGEAWRTIKMGDAQVMMAGGAEAAITPVAMAGFAAMKAMSVRNEEPLHSSRPFDQERDGFVMGEGAAVIILEELEHAKHRGARIYCELSGYGNTADAHHITAPEPSGAGAARCMKMALRSGQTAAEKVDYVNAHGTSTPQGDICETLAIKEVFGEHAKKLAVSSTKGATGHMLGAAGSLEMAICAKAIETGILPPTINYEHPDPKCDLDYVPNESRPMQIDVAISNSFGFGGHNASLLATRFKD